MTETIHDVHVVSETNWQLYLAVIGLALAGLLWYLINSMFRCATPDEGKNLHLYDSKLLQNIERSTLNRTLLKWSVS